MTWGMWIWNLRRCEAGDPDRIAARCRAVGLDHVVLKIADGTTPYNGASLARVVERLQAHGIEVWAWTYTYGRQPEREAEVFGARALQLEANGLVVDLEGDGYSGSRERVRRFMAALRGVAPAAHVGLSSHRFPLLHPGVPVGYAMGWCDSGWPQAYYLHPDVEVAMERVHRQWSAFGRPVVATGAAFPEGTGEAANVARFAAACRRLGVTGVNWWSWEHATPAVWDQIRSVVGEA
ncbi:MAG: hypothetical protein QN183_15885 [Armatimonadota bacterium]|nr:hypothetical protein [Armatimonadota bacterium]